MTIFSIIAIVILGLIVGSFLNVVIIRYPVLLMRQWRKECLAFLYIPFGLEESGENLWWPGSHCRMCNRHLQWFYNLPLLSFIILRGKCAYCKAPISNQYWIIELLTAAATLIVFLKFGFHARAIAGCFLTWILIVLAGIDWRNKILPDSITLLALWIGLILNLHALFIPIDQAIYGAVFGYLFFWTVGFLFAKIRGKQGLGYGDFKLLALLGAWLGPYALIYIIMIAAGISLLVAIILLFRKKIVYTQSLPFGPSLAFAGWIILVFFKW